VVGGGIPGVGDLGMDAEQITEILGEAGELDELGETLGLGDLALMLDTMREWTIAHEVGHMWWHALVGNDSLTAPVIDEPLAQHSACLVERELRPAEAEAVCDVNTSGQFEQMQVLMGVSDAPADQPTAQFDSPVQYAAVVYGKAPMFYRALEERYGVQETTDALASLVRDHAFGQVTPDDVRTALGQALGDTAGVDALWQYWIVESHGTADLAD
jgi:aminopeptidase N